VFRLGSDRTIPSFLSVDVEPDGFQLPFSDPPDWSGYDAMFEIAEQLRSKLTERAGVAPRFGWYFRTDPQIAAVYGRPDHALAEFPERTTRLLAEGDYFGVHSHLIRWCHKEGQWVHDFADAEWAAYCTRFAIQAFSQWQGSPALRFRAGAGFITNTVVDVVEQCGIKVDLGLEPVSGFGLYAAEVATAIDSSPMIGPYTDCHTAPRLPYRPAREDFRVHGEHGCRDLVMVPHTTTTLAPEQSLWRRLRGYLDGRSLNRAMMLSPALEWPSADFFWNLVAVQLRSMRTPYLSLAVRTDAPDSVLVARVRQIFAALPQHPLATRLRFTDPLDVAAGLVSI
jgi:hypothetical protein